MIGEPPNYLANCKNETSLAVSTLVPAGVLGGANRQGLEPPQCLGGLAARHTPYEA